MPHGEGCADEVRRQIGDERVPALAITASFFPADITGADAIASGE
jgi:hypothetical protein